MISENNSKGSIRERIRHADSIDDIAILLNQLASYEWATQRTITACNTAARKRRKELLDAS